MAAPKSGGTGNTGSPPPSASTSAGVAIVDYSFSPSPVTIKVGGTVDWTNTGAATHTVTADDGAWTSGQVAGMGSATYGGTGSAGGSFSRTFAAAGTYTYHCSIHTYMTGTVTVTP